jgi:hypothetical protein
MKVLLPTLGLGGPSHGPGGRSYADQIAGARRFTGSRCGRSMISRPPRPLVDGETVDLGGKEVRTRRVRHLATPHVPHNWESQVLFRGDHRHAAVRRSLLTDRQSASRHLQQPRRRGDRGRAHLPRDLARAGRTGHAAPTRGAAARHTGDHARGSYRGDGGAALRALADAYEAEFPVTRVAT